MTVLKRERGINVMKFNKVVKGGLAAVMAMSLAACSSKSGDDAKGTASTTGEAFKLGGSGPTTGDAAVYGLAVQHGAELAVKEINAEGKVQLELNYQDDQADGEKAVTAFNNLVDWGMQVSIGATTSGAGQAVSAEYKTEDIFALTPSGSSPAVIYQDSDNEKVIYRNDSDVYEEEASKHSAYVLGKIKKDADSWKFIPQHRFSDENTEQDLVDNL